MRVWLRVHCVFVWRARARTEEEIGRLSEFVYVITFSSMRVCTPSCLYVYGLQILLLFSFLTFELTRQAKATFFH